MTNAQLVKKYEAEVTGAVVEYGDRNGAIRIGEVERVEWIAGSPAYRVRPKYSNRTELITRSKIRRTF